MCTNTMYKFIVKACLNLYALVKALPCSCCTKNIARKEWARDKYSTR